jgi:hypothetical protein
VFFVVFLATCFGHTIWPSSGYLRGYVLLYYITLHTYYIYIYTTTRPAIRDLLFCALWVSLCDNWSGWGSLQFFWPVFYFFLRVAILSCVPDYPCFCQSVWLHILVNYWHAGFHFLMVSFLADGYWSLRFLRVGTFMEYVGACSLLTWTSPWHCCSSLLLVLLCVSPSLVSSTDKKEHGIPWAVVRCAWTCWASMRPRLGDSTFTQAVRGLWVVGLSVNTCYLVLYICCKQKLSSHWCQYLWSLCMYRVIWNSCLSEIIHCNTCVFNLFGKWLMSKEHVWKTQWQSWIMKLTNYIYEKW